MLTVLGLVGPARASQESVPAAAARATPAVAQAKTVSAPGSARQIACLDLPVSGAVLDATSCWLTGSESALLVGSLPGDASEGVVVLVQGQRQNVTDLAGSGTLQVTKVNSVSACVLSAGAEYRAVNLVAATVAPSWTPSCALSKVGGTVPDPPATAPGSPGPTPGAGSQIENAPAPVAPSVSPSYYEYYTYYTPCAASPNVRCPLYQQGESTATPPQNGLVVLDFGSPCYVPGTSVYGVEMFFQPTCIPDSSVRSLVENWISGYESQNTETTTNLTVAIGTSNSYNGVDPNYALTDAQMYASGQSWYQNLVGAISTAGLRAPLTLWGGNDMEEEAESENEWSTGTPTVDWVDGYGSVSPARSTCPLSQPGYLADYGDDVLGGTGNGSGDGWTVQQVYDVAWGLPVACAEPEIYFADMATEWQGLSQWAVQNGLRAIQFSGVMTEVETGSLGPNSAWADLESDTGQSPTIPSVTTIAWTLQNLPSVVSTSPAQGPPAGGTVTLITGKYLAGATAVDFGGTAATSFTVNSVSSIAATSPGGGAGYVDVTVQTPAGTSSTSGGDGFIYTAAGAYHAVALTRLEDTRPGSGLPGAGHAPGPGGTLGVQVTGQGGVPSSGVSAVVVNVTVTDPTAAGYISVFPLGVARPVISTVNLFPGETRANLAEVAVGDRGQIAVYNFAGTT
ncbi:MAG: IPT/TIG domain-containing protein, partial [Acidimicrobiales bacterium]